jgi:hypothetical protein
MPVGKQGFRRREVGIFLVVLILTESTKTGGSETSDAYEKVLNPALGFQTYGL